MANKLAQEFIDLLKSLGPEDWKRKSGERTVKDIVAHMIGWEKEDPQIIRETWRTKERPWFTKTQNHDEFNKKHMEYYKNHSPEELIRELEEYQKKVEEVIDEIGEENLRRHSELFYWLFDESGNSHYALHLREIKEAIK